MSREITQKAVLVRPLDVVYLFDYLYAMAIGRTAGQLWRVNTERPPPTVCKKCAVTFQSKEMMDAHCCPMQNVTERRDVSGELGARVKFTKSFKDVTLGDFAVVKQATIGDLKGRVRNEPLMYANERAKKKYQQLLVCFRIRDTATFTPELDTDEPMSMKNQFGNQMLEFLVVHQQRAQRGDPTYGFPTINCVEMDYHQLREVVVNQLQVWFPETDLNTEMNLQMADSPTVRDTEDPNDHNSKKGEKISRTWYLFVPYGLDR